MTTLVHIPDDATTAIQMDPAVLGQRWEQWQRRNAASSRKTEMRMRIIYGFVLAGLGAWLALQVAASPIWL